MKKLIILIAVASMAVFSLQAEEKPANADANAVAQEVAPAMEVNATAENNESNATAENNESNATAEENASKS